MRCAALVHEDLQPRVAPQENPSTAAVIEMDVRQQYVCHVLETNSHPIQAELERIETGRGTWIDERCTAGAAEDCTRDDVRTAAELKVNPVNAGRENGHARARHYTERENPKPQIPKPKSQRGVKTFGSWDAAFCSCDWS